MFDTHFSYKGYEYHTWDEIEFDGDNCKTFHECWKDGKQVKMSRDFYNFSPYSIMTLEQFQTYIDLL